MLHGLLVNSGPLFVGKGKEVKLFYFFILYSTFLHTNQYFVFSKLWVFYEFSTFQGLHKIILVVIWFSLSFCSILVCWFFFRTFGLVPKIDQKLCPIHFCTLKITVLRSLKWILNNIYYRNEDCGTQKDSITSLLNSNTLYFFEIKMTICGYPGSSKDSEELSLVPLHSTLTPLQS